MLLLRKDWHSDTATASNPSIALDQKAPGLILEVAATGANPMPPGSNGRILKKVNIDMPTKPTEIATRASPGKTPPDIKICLYLQTNFASVQFRRRTQFDIFATM